jgi:hypothetical protein
VRAAEPPGGRHPVRTLRRTLALGLVAVAGGAYALVASTTVAFTRSADIVTALPIFALAVLVVVRWPWRPRPCEVDAAEAPHPWRAWIVLSGVVAAWELAEYAARGGRADHPTLSSMLDAVDRHSPLKALVFFLWLSLGAAIVRAGGTRRPRRPAPGAEAS